MPIKTIHYESADRFIDDLSPTGALLGTAPAGQFIFRGHPDARFSLLPSVLRADVAASNAEQVRSEASALLAFLQFADTQGLPIPGDSDYLRIDLTSAATDERFLWTVRAGRDGFLDDTAWPKKSMRGLMALAQHHKLPTRMLDWTRRALVAAYFAAADAGIGGADLIAVWVFDVEKAGMVRRLHHEGVLDVVAVPYATNQNALVQQGLFTVEARTTLLAEGAVDVTPIEAWFVLVDDDENPLLKMTLPASQAGRLLERLARHGVSAATMFPGYDGAARAVGEMKRWSFNKVVNKASTGRRKKRR